MGRGCQWPFAVGRGAPSYNDVGEGARAAHDRFRDPTINELIGEKEKHYCFGKIVDEDPLRGKCIRSCDICGKIYEVEK